jgi:hypothetical protein
MLKYFIIQIRCSVFCVHMLCFIRVHPWRIMHGFACYANTWFIFLAAANPVRRVLVASFPILSVPETYTHC